MVYLYFKLMGLSEVQKRFLLGEPFIIILLSCFVYPIITIRVCSGPTVFKKMHHVPCCCFAFMRILYWIIFAHLHVFILCVLWFYKDYFYPIPLMKPVGQHFCIFFALLEQTWGALEHITFFEVINSVLPLLCLVTFILIRNNLVCRTQWIKMRKNMNG